MSTEIDHLIYIFTIDIPCPQFAILHNHDIEICEAVPDQIGTLAQVGTSPNLGWPNKELRGSPPG